MAAVTLGDDPAALSAHPGNPRPGLLPEVAQGFAGHEVVRAAAWLAAWGDAPRARVFLLRMDDLAPIPAERSLTAARGSGCRTGVRRPPGRARVDAARNRLAVPFEPPSDFDAAVALGIMRQESGFDIAAISPSAPWPDAVDAVHRAGSGEEAGHQTSLPALTSDTTHNMRLGTTYLRDMRPVPGLAAGRRRL